MDHYGAALAEIEVHSDGRNIARGGVVRSSRTLKGAHWSPGYLVDGPEDVQPGWFEGKEAVGVTAGASAPEVLVERVVDRLAEWGGTVPEEVAGRPEKVVFSLPKVLRTA